MTKEQLIQKLEAFLNLPAEVEWLEFKEAKNDYSFDKLGKYFSALSNEANLKKEKYGWLIFGVNDKHQVIGTNYRPNQASLDSLKKEVADQTNGDITLEQVNEIEYLGKRVLMLQIPPAPRGIPVSWKGHFYGRHNESLSALSLNEMEQIRNQGIEDDWSSEIIVTATIKDLDPDAIKVAKEKFTNKVANRRAAKDIDSWDDITFLNKAKLTISGQITRAALLLLGREESTHFLNPAVAEITWKLETEEQAYEHFGPPFLLNSEAVFRCIRNIKFKIQPFNQLIPIELTKYEPWIILEALHNCIAHQDYTRNARIIVTEKTDRLIFQNAGSFFEGAVNDYVLEEKTPERYRNKFLAQAMVNLDMIDTMGYGIRTMFIEQRKRYFPLPEYDLSSPDKVELEIMGKLIDENYSRLLMDNIELPLDQVISLDKVQKHKELLKTERELLRKNKLIEGRYPNLYVASHIAGVTGKKAQYIKNKAFDNEHYKNLVISYLTQFKQASKKEIKELLQDKLPDLLNERQKDTKIKNLLSEMSNKDHLIKSEGRTTAAVWKLVVG